METAALERSVARVAVAQTLRSLGFTAARGSALEALTGVVLRFLGEAAHLAHESAQQAGRGAVCLPDVLRALRLLGADVPRLVAYVSACSQGTAAEVPFAQPLPRYPVRKRPKRVYASFQEKGEAPPGGHLAKWLPALPDAHTYHTTAVHRPAGGDDARVRRELTQQTVSAEAKLARLEEALHPGEPADYTASRRWGGRLDLPDDALVHLAAAEQRAVLQLTAPDAAAAENPFLRAAAAAAVGGGGALLAAPARQQHRHGGGHASGSSSLALAVAGGGGPSAAGHHLAPGGGGGGAQATALAVLTALPSGPERGARGDTPAASGVTWVAMDTPASQGIRHLVSVDTFSLKSGDAARATARMVAGAAAGLRGGSFAAMPGRSGFDDDDEADPDDEAAKKAGKDAARVAKMMARDPHGPLLEDYKDLINQ